MKFNYRNVMALYLLFLFYHNRQPFYRLIFLLLNYSFSKETFFYPIIKILPHPSLRNKFLFFIYVFSYIPNVD